MSNRGDEAREIQKLEALRKQIREQRRMERAVKTKQHEQVFIGLAIGAFVVGALVLIALLTGCRSGLKKPAPIPTPPPDVLTRPPIEQSGEAPSPPANDDTQLRRGLATSWRPEDLNREVLGKTAPRPRRRPSGPPVRIIDPLGRPQPLTWTFDADSKPARTPEHMLPWKLCVYWADKADDNQYSCSEESGGGERIKLQVLIPGRVYDRPWAIEGVYRRYEARILENGVEIAKWRGMIVQRVAEPKVEVAP